jgi:hypothetical protein
MANLLLAILNYMNKNYKAAMFSAFCAGAVSTAIMYQLP